MIGSSSEVLDSVYYIISPGKTDPKNPSQRIFQKGSTDDLCFHYAVRLIAPRKGDSDYSPEMGLKSRAVSEFCKSFKPFSTKLSFEFTQKCREFFESQGITNESILEYITIRAIQGTKSLANCKFLSEKDAVRFFLGNSCLRKKFKEFEKSDIFFSFYRNRLYKLYRDIFSLKMSNFDPVKDETDELNFDRLVIALKESGPMLVKGFFGQPYYGLNQPTLVFDKMIGKVLAWKPNQREAVTEDEVHHCVLLTGAMSFRQKGQLGYRVYFVDPNDSSDPSVARRVYVMSGKTFFKNLGEFDAFENPRSMKPSYGIQKNLSNDLNDIKKRKI